MNIIFETSRLYFRNFTPKDTGLIYELNIHPDVTRFTHDPISSLEQAKEILEKTILPQYVLYKHGRWAVHLKNDLEFIGWCGLKMRPERNEIDLGYRFLKQAWGKGFATEAAFASIKFGFEKLNLKRIVGRAMPENLASISVLEKCEMSFIGEEIVDGHTARTYEILNPDLF